MRIVSLLPSATEMLYLLGLDNMLHGVSYECDYPVEARSKAIVVKPRINTEGKTQGEIDSEVSSFMREGKQLYMVDMEAIRSIKPDIVITQDLCDVCAISMKDVVKATEDLSKECEVISMQPKSIGEMLDDIIRIGKACRVERKAEEEVAKLRGRIEAVKRRAKEAGKIPRVLCAEWYDPIYASGHWIPEMVRIAGGIDGLGCEGGYSRVIEWKKIVEYSPEVMVMMPCGFDVGRAIADMWMITRNEGWNGLDAVRDGRVYAANGSWYYSRHGPRLIDGLEYLAKMIHPEVFGSELPEEAAVRITDGRIREGRPICHDAV